MIQDNLSAIAKKYGVKFAIKVVGGIDTYIKIMHDGDLSNFYKKSKLTPYHLSDNKMTLYIDDFIVQMYGFEDDKFATAKQSKKLGDFRYGTKDHMCYKFEAHICPHFLNGNSNFMNGQKMWRVQGTSGDKGFDYWWITKKNTLGVRHRTQIYKQIIERFKLNDYLPQ
jgi:hypothetical protein